MTLDDSATETSLLNNQNFIGALQIGFANALSGLGITGVTASDIRITAIRFVTTNTNARRSLTSADKVLEIDYEVRLASDASTSDVAAVTQKVSSSGSGAAAFATALQTSVKEAVEADSSLSSVVTDVKGATAKGDATVTTVDNGSSGGDTGSLGGLGGDGTSAAASTFHYLPMVYLVYLPMVDVIVMVCFPLSFRALLW